MGAPRLSILRRKPPRASSSSAASTSASPSAAADTPPTKSTTGPPVFFLPKKFGLRSSSSTATATTTNSKNAPRPESVSSGYATEDTVTSSSSDAAAAVEGGAQQQQQLLKGEIQEVHQKNNGANSTSNSSSSNSSNKPKRSIRLSISPDTEESESMQVTFMEGSPIQMASEANGDSSGIGSDGGSGGCYSNAKEDDCIYTVGSVDYLVKDATPRAAPKCEDVVDGKPDIANHADATPNAAKETTKNANAAASEDTQEEVAAEGGEKKKKSSKLGGMFKKSGKKSGGAGGSSEKGGGGSNDNNGNNNNNSNAGGSGSGGGGDQNGDKKDNDQNNNNNNNDQNNQPIKTPSTTTNFSPHRTNFAIQSTLPLHTGPESTAPQNKPSWTPVTGTEFKVRAGPNYPKNGRKECSLESLYEVYCVRYYRSAKRTVGGATRIMPLPEDMIMMGGGDGEGAEDVKIEAVEGDASATDSNNTNSSSSGGVKHHPELNHTKIPDVLVVHFMLPYEPPNMFKQKDDGPGGECIYYLKPSQRFLDEVSGKIPPTPATKLFVKWSEECEHDAKMRSRFKCMALVRELEKHNLGLLKNYNGKPVLITESGRVCGGWQGDVRYLEMTANVHYWAFMAKKGFVSLIPKFANMQMEVGFTIEAHTDSEMPECMLGSTVLSYISEDTGPLISAEMQEPVHEHQS